MKTLIKICIVTILASVIFTGCFMESECEHTGGTATCMEKAVCEICGESYGEALGHDIVIDEAVEPTCTETGLTVGSHCSRCDDATLPQSEIGVKGHSFSDMEGLAPTCTEDGYTDYMICDICQHVEGKDVIPAEHKWVDATCTAPKTCSECSTTEGDVAEHIDANLDITCDFDGCTHRILPAADSKISLFTANHMIIVSLSSSYYVEGVVTEVIDSKNGIFVIKDEEENTILIRLPKNAEGNLYSSWTENKLVLGDKVQVYGKPSRNTGSPNTQTAKIESGILTVLEHTHAAVGDKVCTKPTLCGCGYQMAEATGHVDADENDLCDNCNWNMNLTSTQIAIGTDSKYNGVTTNGDDGKALYWTWSNDNFDAVIHKGQSTFTLYTNAKDYMQLKKLNTLTVSGKNGELIKSITIFTTNATQLTNLKGAIGSAYVYTENAESFSLTIELDSVAEFVISHVGSTTVYISGVEIVY